jgi:hypothetical protein
VTWDYSKRKVLGRRGFLNTILGRVIRVVGIL